MIEPHRVVVTLATARTAQTHLLAQVWYSHATVGSNYHTQQPSVRVARQLRHPLYVRQFSECMEKSTQLHFRPKLPFGVYLGIHCYLHNNY